ncbi:hyaluronate lyase N-terminal domain-containing protein [Cohnella fermenti]|uniref:Phage tail protein n=1 Tax=Cohnella fermenti TaxID=2565925 RepID=A0A4S4BSN2_9BACL|nr:phage tail protein [Cohnella fermenti]THF78017.1 phage tail protein [Cohnella fermenti]
MARKVLIQIRRGLEAAIGTLADGELGYCTDSKKLYVGTASSGNVLLVAAQSVGDMLKGIYDTNGNGKVDSSETADSVAWTGVSGKPTTLSGYGITDAATKLEVAAKLSPGVTWNQLKGV